MSLLFRHVLVSFFSQIMPFRVKEKDRALTLTTRDRLQFATTMIVRSPLNAINSADTPSTSFDEILNCRTVPSIVFICLRLARYFSEYEQPTGLSDFGDAVSVLDTVFVAFFLLCLLATLALFGAIHCLAWNSVFPTHTK
jgi:hypothetical protein